jgi:hypothetical protein
MWDAAMAVIGQPDLVTVGEATSIFSNQFFLGPTSGKIALGSLLIGDPVWLPLTYLFFFLAHLH